MLQIGQNHISEKTGALEKQYPHLTSIQPAKNDATQSSAENVSIIVGQSVELDKIDLKSEPTVSTVKARELKQVRGAETTVALQSVQIGKNEEIDKLKQTVGLLSHDGKKQVIGQQKTHDSGSENYKFMSVEQG